MGTCSHKEDANANVLLHAVAGSADPGPPKKAVANTGRTYKTKEETAKTKTVTGTIVVVLLGISVVVPMLQYWGYTSKD